MSDYNRHLLAEGAHRVNRDAAAREQRAKDAALLRDMADQRDNMAALCVEEAAAQEEHAANWLRAAADRIEAGR